MLADVDLSESQHCSPPLACLSAINEHLSQLVVYKKSQCLPIARISFSIPHSSLPMMPFKRRDLANVPCMWGDIEGCVFIDEEALLQKGTFPQSREAMRIYKRQVDDYRRRFAFPFLVIVVGLLYVFISICFCFVLLCSF
eukprot:m.107848 g.107848  ORF g.107848 m.107848 type:complete len:140 (-) comp12698_c0_seq22:788-1207(-)